MEQERAKTGAGHFAYTGAISPMWALAALSALVLVTVAAFQIGSSGARTTGSAITSTTPIGSSDNTSSLQGGGAPALGTATTTAATSSDPLSSLGQNVMADLASAYAQMQASGTYSSSTAQAVGASLAPYMNAQLTYPTFSQSDIPTDPNISYQRAMRYRSALQTSLAPLLKNTEPEYEIFAYYVQTGDPSYLAKLESAANNYRAAASSTAKVVVPADAVQYQVEILNAMEEFAATLDAMAAHAQDPFASTALLNTYNQAENDMLTSFNDLATYFKSKTP